MKITMSIIYKGHCSYFRLVFCSLLGLVESICVVSLFAELEEVVDDCLEHPNKMTSGKAKQRAVLKYLFIVFPFIRELASLYHNLLLLSKHFRCFLFLHILKGEK